MKTRRRGRLRLEVTARSPSPNCPPTLWITNQYTHLGIHFTDGSDQIRSSSNLFVDGFGLNGAFDESTLEFDSPMTTLAMDFPGGVNVKLYFSGRLFYTGPVFGGSGVGHFIGLISTQPFDKVFVYDPGSGLSVDNLYFGPPVPGPGVLGALLSFAVLRPARRRMR